MTAPLRRLATLILVVLFLCVASGSLSRADESTSAKPTTLSGWCDWAWQRQETYTTFETCEAAAHQYRAKLKGAYTTPEALTAMLAAACYMQAGLTLRRMKRPFREDLGAARALLRYALQRPLSKKFQNVATNEVSLLDDLL